MYKDELIAQLTSLFDEYLSSRGLDLVDLIVRQEGRDLSVRLLVDRPSGGITLEECASVNSDLGRILEERNLIEQRYVLEVSSPGIDRPLRTERDFLRCLNRSVRLFLNETVEGKWELEGRITSASADSVQVDIAGRTVEIPLSKVARAKQSINAS